AKFDITESESLLFGTGFGIGTDIRTGPNGNLFLVSNTHGIVYEIFRNKWILNEKKGSGGFFRPRREWKNPPDPFFRSSEPAQLLHGLLQRTPASRQVGPHIADLRDAGGHVPQRERAGGHLAVLDFLPRARCGHRRAALRPHRVCGGESGPVTVPARVHVDSPAAIGLAELLGQTIGREAHEHPAYRLGEARNGSGGGLSVQRNGDVETLRAGR